MVKKSEAKKKGVVVDEVVGSFEELEINEKVMVLLL
jgi:hypothetical protein